MSHETLTLCVWKRNTYLYRDEQEKHLSSISNLVFSDYFSSNTSVKSYIDEGSRIINQKVSVSGDDGWVHFDVN